MFLKDEKTGEINNLDKYYQIQIMRKMRRTSLPFFLLLIFLSITNCKSVSGLKNSNQQLNNLRNQIELHVKYLNDGNAQGLESVYTADFEGLSPITKFKNKQELVHILVKNQKEQQLKVEFEIIEIFVKSKLAYAVLDWKAFTNANTIDQQLLYNKKHFQVWELINKEWQLKRSLFYN